MHQLTHKFRQYAALLGLSSDQDHLLIGVSGGLDSVVLCHLLKETGRQFEIAHMNFQLRGAESNRDEAFVRELATQLAVPFHLVRVDTEIYANSQKKSIQVAARELRYQWFEQLMTDRKTSGNPLRFLLTAHHANDNAETILLNIFRGSGIAGLRGILPYRDNIRRPLLFALRQDLLEFATANNLQWVEDSSNASNKYARNFIRNIIIPQVEEQFPAVVSTLNESAEHMRETELFLNNALQKCLQKLVVVKGGQPQIPVEGWRKLPGAAAVLFAWLKPYGFSAAQVPDAMALAQSQTGHYVDSENFRLLRNRNWLVLTPKEEKAAGLILLEQEEGRIEFSSGNLVWDTANYMQESIPGDQHIAWLDASKIIFPVLLRPWKAGDYFYPLGMAKKKKLARFLTDIKLSRTVKDQVWVLESDRRILWVIGQRIDDRFKVKTSTKKVLNIQFNTLP